MAIGIYSLLLALALAVSAPLWLWRMARGNRYREGLLQRLGFVPAALSQAARGKRVLWLHAVSVGEVLAAERLIRELQHALPTHFIALSTTTATAQKIARDRFKAEAPKPVPQSNPVPHSSTAPSSMSGSTASGSAASGSAAVFYFPLDFAFAVRPYLRALRPELVILMESELWPRLLAECARARIPVAVVNARISDRSFPRYLRLRLLWHPLLAKVALFLAQGEETAARLRQIGVPSNRIQVPGNLKYDLRPPTTAMTDVLRSLLGRRRLVVGGSLLLGEEPLLLNPWFKICREVNSAVLLLAPRHPQRFAEVADMGLPGMQVYRASELLTQAAQLEPLKGLKPLAVIILDTIGDLASIYELADVAFLGGSLVPKGGHNPLEAARFGVPVVMGDSYENFREIVEGMRSAEAIRIVQPQALADTLIDLLRNGKPMGERGRIFFQSQSGATARTVEALLALLPQGVSEPCV